MKVIAIDDNEISLEILADQLKTIREFTEIKAFMSSVDASEWLKSNPVDFAFLDIMMNDMDGIELAKNIRTIRPEAKIIFCSSSEDYALEAFRVHADGYLTKPVSQKDLREEIDSISKRLNLDIQKEPVKNEKRLHVQCFGNFDVYYDGLPLHFKYQKSKELLAYLVHRNGATCSVRELVAVLYENLDDSPSLQSQLRTLISELNKTLKSVGQEDVLYRKRGVVSVLPDKISCDYYDFLTGDEEAVRKYSGEYMVQYPWADTTAAYLERSIQAE